jgi:hypothetical protein
MRKRYDRILIPTTFWEARIRTNNAQLRRGLRSNACGTLIQLNLRATIQFRACPLTAAFLMLRIDSVPHGQSDALQTFRD